MIQDSFELTAEELKGLKNRLVVRDSPSSEFSEDSDWSVTSIESKPSGRVTIWLRSIDDGRQISIVIPLADFQDPVFRRDRSKILGKVFDIGMTIMEFSGMNDLEQFQNNQTIEVTVGGSFRVLD